MKREGYERRITMNETVDRVAHLAAFRLFTSLSSGYFFSWTDTSAGFRDEVDTAEFKRQYPDWKV